MSFATLGDDITFEVNADKVYTWTKNDRSGEGRWHEHDVFSVKPVSEFLGPGNDTIKLSIRLDLDRGVVPLDELKRMRLARDTGAVLQFTIGGKLVGDFTLRSLDEEQLYRDGKGTLTTAIAQVTLREYS